MSERNQTMRDMGYVPASRGEERGWVYQSKRPLDARGHSIMRPDPKTTRWWIYSWVNGERQPHRTGPFTNPVAAAVFMQVELSQ